MVFAIHFYTFYLNFLVIVNDIEHQSILLDSKEIFDISISNCMKNNNEIAQSVKILGIIKIKILIDFSLQNI